MSQDYNSVLARTVAEAGRDHTQLRMLVYKAAGSELWKELHRAEKFATYTDKMREVSALEAAIDRLESNIVGYLGSSSNGAFPRQAPIGSAASALTFGRESREVPTSHELAVPTSGT